MWPKLTVNDCVHMAVYASNEHLRTYWMNTARALLDAIPPVDERYADGGLTMQTGSLYRLQAGYSRDSRLERIHRYGISY